MRRHLRLVLAGALVLGGSSLAAAQGRQIGLKAGASVATLHPEASQISGEPLEPRAGLTAGAFAVFPLQSRLAIQLEALFTDKGGTQAVPDPTILRGVLLDRLRFHYLDVPVLLRVSGPQAGSARLHGFIGPTLSVRLGAKYESALSASGSWGTEYDIAQDTRRFDAGLTVGGGAEFGPRLVLDARYTLGLADVLEEQLGTPVTNRGFLVTVGVRIF
jgi:hypothetical protein